MDFPLPDYRFRLNMTDSLHFSSRGGWLIRTILVVAVLGVIFMAGWIVLLPGIIVSTIQARTGFIVKVEQLSINPFGRHVEITGAVVENPMGWPAPEFLVLRHFKVEAELRPFLSNRFVADKMIIDVEKLSLVRNQTGVLNADAFQQGIVGAKKSGEPEKPKGESRKTDFLIRRLVVKFDRLVMSDYSGKKPLIKEYDLQIERELNDVDSVAKLVSPFVGVALNATRGLFDATPGALDQTVNSLQQTGKKSGGSSKKFFQALENKKP